MNRSSIAALLVAIALLGCAQRGFAQPGFAPPSIAPPSIAPPGFEPPGFEPPGFAPPGFAPPGFAPPGFAPPGFAPPGIAPTNDAFNWKSKLQFHAAKAGGPVALLGFAAYAAAKQELNSPREWGQGGSGYGKRLASIVGWAGIHGTLAFGLDTALHQDPRYHRGGGPGFLRRVGHAARGTLLTRTDSGGETLSTWRLGSDYGAAFLSDLWYPARLNTSREGFLTGSVTLGFDLVSNLGSEFWPDIKKGVFHRKSGP